MMKDGISLNLLQEISDKVKAATVLEERSKVSAAWLE